MSKAELSEEPFFGGSPEIEHIPLDEVDLGAILTDQWADPEDVIETISAEQELAEIVKTARESLKSDNERQAFDYDGILMEQFLASGKSLPKLVEALGTTRQRLYTRLRRHLRRLREAQLALHPELAQRMTSKEHYEFLYRIALNGLNES